MPVKRFSCSVRCPRCSKTWKSSKPVWRHMMASHQLHISPVDFIGENEEIVDITKPVILCGELLHYHQWLTTLTERVNEALHPALPGRWTKIEDPCVPEKYVLHFLAELLEQTDEIVSPHSVSYNCHRGVPYRMRTKRVSYRVHTLMALKRVLEAQGKVKLDSNVAFCHFEKVNASSSTSLTMKQKIARAKANASNLTYAERVEQAPTSHISLVVSEGEGRATREAEISYWPDLYKATNSYKFQLRFYVMKCELF